MQELLARALAGPALDMAQAGRDPARLRAMVDALLGAAPGAGDVMAAQDSQRAGQVMAQALAGGDYGRAASSGLESLAHALGALPMVPAFAGMLKSGGKLFDYSKLDQVPDVPQENIARPAAPARGYPEYVLKAIAPANVSRMREIVERGIPRGGKEWYNTEPLRQAFVEELGEASGNAAHRLYMELIAGTSTRSKVPENVRNASYYFHLLKSGQPLPKEPPLPQPYGHLAQKQHIKQVTDISERGGLDLMKNPKPSSFVENLRGNQAPVTIDTHNVRALGLTDAQGRPVDMPVGSHYGLLESVQQAAAKEMGLTPAQWQASAWLGGAEETGLKSSIEPFLATFEGVVERTAKARGLPKQKVLKDFLNGRTALLGLGPLGAALATSLMGGDAEDGQDGS